MTSCGIKSMNVGQTIPSTGRRLIALHSSWMTNADLRSASVNVVGHRGRSTLVRAILPSRLLLCECVSQMK
jgi:hypothetical protein